MGFVNFLISGAEVDDGYYNRFNDLFYTQDSHTAYSEKAGLFEGKKTSEINLEFDSHVPGVCRIIDEVVNVSSVPQETRNSNLAFWSKKRVQILAFSTFVVLGGSALTVAAALMFPAWIAVAIGVTTLCLTLFLYFRIKDTQTQIQAWKDPIVNIQNTRKEVGQLGTQGFPYVFKNELKSNVVSASETQQLWENWAVEFFTTYKNTPMEKIKLAQIERFFELNPLDKVVLGYAKPEQKAHIVQLIPVYQKIKTKYTKRKTTGEIIRSKLLSQKNQRLEEIEKEHFFAIKKVERIFSEIKKPYINKVKSLEKAYQAKMNQINQDFEAIDKSKPQREIAAKILQTKDLQATKESYEPQISQANQELQKILETYTPFCAIALEQVEALYKNRIKKTEALYEEQQGLLKGFEKNTFKYADFIIDLSNAFLNPEVLLSPHYNESEANIEIPPLENINPLFTLPPEWQTHPKNEELVNFFEQLQN